MPCDLCRSEKPLIAVAVTSPVGRKVGRQICEGCMYSISEARMKMLMAKAEAGDPEDPRIKELHRIAEMREEQR